MLAASGRGRSRVRVLLGLGARLYEALLHACHENYYSIALQVLATRSTASSISLSFIKLS